MYFHQQGLRAVLSTCYPRVEIVEILLWESKPWQDHLRKSSAEIQWLGGRAFISEQNIPTCNNLLDIKHVEGKIFLGFCFQDYQM